MMTNKYTVLDSNGLEVWMVQTIVECGVCKRACVAHGKSRECDENHRTSFAFLDTKKLSVAVRDNREWICWVCQDAIYRPEPQTKVSNREEPSQ